MHKEVGVYTVTTSPVGSKIELILAKGNGETIKQVYARLNPKPDVLINGNMYNMSTRKLVQGFRIGETVYCKANYGGHILSGIGTDYTIKQRPSINFTSDFAIEGTGIIKPWDMRNISTNFTSNGVLAGRHTIGLKGKQIVTVSTTIARNYASLQAIADDLALDYMLVLDGGGSIGVIHEGKTIINSSRPNMNYVAIYYPTPEQPKKIVFQHRPAQSERITSPFGWRGNSFHDGVDIGALKQGVEGDPLYAVADGVVSISKIDGAGLYGGYGYYIVIKHDGFSTLYGHLQGLMVKVGQKVKAGEIIARMGNTGSSTGAHVHFRLSTEENIRFGRDSNGITYGSINPQPYIDAVTKLPQIKEIASVTYQGKKLTGYINTDNRTVIEVREFAEMLGLSVEWDMKTRTVILK